MDWLTRSEKVRLWIKEYRYVILVLVLGILLMMLPQGKTEEKKDDNVLIPETERWKRFRNSWNSCSARFREPAWFVFC